MEDSTNLIATITALQENQTTLIISTGATEKATAITPLIEKFNKSTNNTNGFTNILIHATITTTTIPTTTTTTIKTDIRKPIINYKGAAVDTYDDDITSRISTHYMNNNNHSDYNDFNRNNDDGSINNSKRNFHNNFKVNFNSRHVDAVTISNYKHDFTFIQQQQENEQEQQIINYYDDNNIAIITDTNMGGVITTKPYSHSINANVNLLLGGAMLTIMATILCIVCYCCHRSIRKRTEAAYRQQQQQQQQQQQLQQQQQQLLLHQQEHLWHDNGANMEVYSVEQCYENARSFLNESIRNGTIANVPVLLHQPPPSYDAVLAMQEHQQQQFIMQRQQFNILENSPPPGYRSALDLTYQPIVIGLTTTTTTAAEAPPLPPPEVTTTTLTTIQMPTTSLSLASPLTTRTTTTVAAATATTEGIVIAAPTIPVGNQMDPHSSTSQNIILDVRQQPLPRPLPPLPPLPPPPPQQQQQQQQHSDLILGNVFDYNDNLEQQHIQHHTHHHQHHQQQQHQQEQQNYYYYYHDEQHGLNRNVLYQQQQTMNASTSITDNMKKNALNAPSCCSLQRAEVENMWHTTATPITANASFTASTAFENIDHQSNATNHHTSSNDTKLRNYCNNNAITMAQQQIQQKFENSRKQKASSHGIETFGGRYLKQSNYRNGCPLCGKFCYDNDTNLLSSPSLASSLSSSSSKEEIIIIPTTIDTVTLKVEKAKTAKTVKQNEQRMNMTNLTDKYYNHDCKYEVDTIITDNINETVNYDEPNNDDNAENQCICETTILKKSSENKTKTRTNKYRKINLKYQPITTTITTMSTLTLTDVQVQIMNSKTNSINNGNNNNNNNNNINNNNDDNNKNYYNDNDNDNDDNNHYDQLHISILSNDNNRNCNSKNVAMSKENVHIEQIFHNNNNNNNNINNNNKNNDNDDNDDNDDDDNDDDDGYTLNHSMEIVADKINLNMENALAATTTTSAVAAIAAEIAENEETIIATTSIVTTLTTTYSTINANPNILNNNLDFINDNGIISLDMSKIIDNTGLPTYDAALKLESSGYV